MIYLVAGTLIVISGLLLQHSGYYFIGSVVFIIGVALGIKGNRQVYGKKTGNQESRLLIKRILIALVAVFLSLLVLLRGGPHWLDSFGADLRWKPPVIMPPVFPGNLPLADSSMLHGASYRPEKNVDAPRYTA
jgi:hypothetical protein